MGKNTLVWAWVDKSIQALVRSMASNQGVSVSEYVRQLIIEDLDKRSVFTTKLKECLGPPSSQKVPPLDETSQKRTGGSS
jgi:hypothetical protein